MNFYVHQEMEEPKHSSKTFSLFRAAVKQAFGQCCAFQASSRTLNMEEESTVSDIIDEQEVVILAIRTRAMEEKLRRKKKGCTLPTESFRWVISPANTAGELMISAANSKRILSQQKQLEEYGDDDDDDDEKETFFSAESCFSRCSSASKEMFASAGRCFSHCPSSSREAFLSSRSCLSRCSSARVTDFSNVNGRRFIIQEFDHCEGWPFGLCRKAMLLPPLPKSPSESWLWRRAPRTVK